MSKQNSYRNRQKDGEKLGYRQGDTETVRQRDRETYIKTERQRQRDRETYKQRDRETHINRETFK